MRKPPELNPEVFLCERKNLRLLKVVLKTIIKDSFYGIKFFRDKIFAP